MKKSLFKKTKLAFRQLQNIQKKKKIKSCHVSLRCRRAGHLSNGCVWQSHCNVLRSRRSNNKAQEHVNNITLY